MWELSSICILNRNLVSSLVIDTLQWNIKKFQHLKYVFWSHSSSVMQQHHSKKYILHIKHNHCWNMVFFLISFFFFFLKPMLQKQRNINPQLWIYSFSTASFSVKCSGLYALKSLTQCTSINISISCHLMIIKL